MYRDNLEEIRKEKNIPYKEWSEKSGVSVDTIKRIIHPENPLKDSPKVNTLEDLCKGLGVEVWEVFYLGDKSFVALQAEINSLKAERDALIADNAVQKDKIETLRNEVDKLKDEVLAMYRDRIKRENNK